MLTVGQRLIKERKRLGISKVDMASVGGISRVSQASYEADKTSPNGEYLIRVSKVGVDVNYVLFGNSQSENINNYSDDFLEVMELKLAECQKNLHQFESSIQMMQQALAEIKQKQ